MKHSTGKPHRYKKKATFWGVTPCNLVEDGRRFEGTCWIHLQSIRIPEFTLPPNPPPPFLYTEDEGSTFLQHICKILPNYTTSQHYSWSPPWALHICYRYKLTELLKEKFLRLYCHCVDAVSVISLPPEFVAKLCGNCPSRLCDSDALSHRGN
jgi:hypothetical protein